MLFKNKNCEKCGNNYDSSFEECPVCKTKDRNFDSLNVPKKLFWLSQFQQLGVFLVGFAYGGFFALKLLFSNVFAKIAESNLSLFILLANSAIYLSLLVVFILIAWSRLKILLKQFLKWQYLLYGLAFAVLLILISTFHSLLMSMLEVQINDNQSHVVETVLYCPPLALVMLGIIGPIVEEFTYRVGLYTYVRRLNKYVAIIVSAIIFGFIHFSFDAEDLTVEFMQLPNYIAAGIVFAVAYETGGFPCSAVAHIVYNTYSLVQILVLK